MLSPFETGWHIGVTNIPEPFIKCWINEVTYGNVNQTICEDAANSEDEFLQDELNNVTLYWSLCTSILAIGAILGGLIGGPLSDKYGRKKILTFNSIFASLVCIFLGSARMIGNYPAFVIARTLIGLVIGINSSISPVYLSEIAPLSQKGTFCATYSIGTVFGIFFAQIISLNWVLGTNNFWPIALVLGIVPCLCQFILSFFVPESPVWLMENGYNGDAQLVEISLKGAVEETSNLSANSEDKTETESLLTNIINLVKDPPVRAALYHIIFFQVVQQLCGFNALFFYSGSIFTNAGIPSEYSGLATVGLGVVNIIGVIIAVAMVGSYGRVNLFFWSILGVGLCTVAMTVLISFSTEGSVIAYLTILPTLLYVLIFQLGVGPIPWMIAVELVPYRYSAGSAAVAASTNWFFAFVVGLCFPPLNDLLDQYVFIIFSVVCFSSAFYTKMYTVESRGRSIEEVQEIYKLKVEK